jgi:hypothetical protein
MTGFLLAQCIRECAHIGQALAACIQMMLLT